MTQIFYCLLAMVFSSSINASDLATANSLFEKRDQSRKYVNDAQRIYLKIISDKSKKLEDRSEALTMYARLAIFEGEVAVSMYNVTNKESEKIFDACIEATDYLNPKKIGKHIPEYVYYRLVCIGLWAAHIKKAKLVVTGLPRMKEIKDLVANGQKNFKAYDNYGFDRIEAGMYVHDESLAKFGLWNPEKSLNLINEAIEKGQEIHVACMLKSKVLLVMGRQEEAKQAILLGIDVLEKRMKETAENSIESRLFLETMNEEFMRLSKH